MIRDMKNIIKILFFSWICMAVKCQDKESENCHTSIIFSNNSEKNLRVRELFGHSIHYPDPLDITKFSYTAEWEKCKINSGEQSNTRATNRTGCYEDTFKSENYSDMVYVYVFDAAIVENTAWDVVARDYLVLKRYDLTLADLQRLDWKITYPPTEAMKDVKQYPPYGE